MQTIQHLCSDWKAVKNSKRKQLDQLKLPLQTKSSACSILMSQFNLFQTKAQLSAFWSSEKLFSCPNKRNQFTQTHPKNTKRSPVTPRQQKNINKSNSNNKINTLHKTKKLLHYPVPSCTKKRSNISRAYLGIKPSFYNC